MIIHFKWIYGCFQADMSAVLVQVFFFFWVMMNPGEATWTLQGKWLKDFHHATLHTYAWVRNSYVVWNAHFCIKLILLSFFVALSCSFLTVRRFQMMGDKLKTCMKETLIGLKIWNDSKPVRVNIFLQFQMQWESTVHLSTSMCPAARTASSLWHHQNTDAWVLDAVLLPTMAIWDARKTSCPLWTRNAVESKSVRCT